MTDKEISSIINKTYPFEVQVVGRVSKNKLLLKHKPEKFILEKFPHSRLERFRYEIDLGSFLRNKGFHVPTVIKTKEGNTYVKKNKEVFVLRSFLDGDFIDKHTATLNQISSVGAFAGNHSSVLENYPDRRFPVKLGKLRQEKVKSLKIQTGINLWNVYQEAAKNLKRLYPNLAFGVVNQDFDDHNLLFKNGQAYGLFDFGDCQYGPLVLDFSIVLAHWSLSHGKLIPARIKTILGSYTNKRKINEPEKAVSIDLLKIYLIERMAEFGEGRIFSKFREKLLAFIKAESKIVEALELHL